VTLEAYDPHKRNSRYLAQIPEDIMKKIASILLFALLATLGFAGWAAAAQQAPEKKAVAKAVRWSGTIDRIDRDNSILTVRKRGGTMSKPVHFDSSTKWTKRDGSPIDASQIKEGDWVVCNGYMEKDKFMANDISVRSGK
jgi:hypothetical protein